VWVDGQYVGYLNELKGSNKLLLLPGKHIITVRQNGYHDFDHCEGITTEVVGTHQIQIACPGYQTFETQVNVPLKQTVEIKTDLLKSNGPLAEPLLMR
jgi:hypothetical protein